MKGEEKSLTQKLCFYGPDGKVQKQQLSAPPPPQQQAPGGVKGKVIARKEEEISDYMKAAVALVHQYVPPDKQRIDTVVAAKAVSVTPSSGGATMFTLKNYLKKGDEFAVSIDTANNSLRTIGGNRACNRKRMRSRCPSLSDARAMASRIRPTSCSMHRRRRSR
jgi:hypothetical protein